MKLIRIIPSLLIQDGVLVKGKNFENHKYVGDIFNAIKIFSEKKAHEIILIDINARTKSRIIDINLIKKIRQKTTVPLCVGGGINSLDHISNLIYEGAEKILINSNFLGNENLLNKASKKFGSQSLIVSVDIIFDNENSCYLFCYSTKKRKKINLENYLKNIEDQGAGEILLTSVDRDGTKKGLNINLYKYCEKFVQIPIIASGGVKNLDDLVNLFDSTTLSAASAGSNFVFFGARDAVLINYFDIETTEKLMAKYE